MSSIENRENFYMYHLDNLIDLYDNLKDKYKLTGFMDNSKLYKFIEIILDNIIFKDIDIEDDSDNDNYNDTSDDDYVE
tara:strand:- start:210 stop:443 length:234 start_codon:yes stop_codon:yes gene_type:complete